MYLRDCSAYVARSQKQVDFCLENIFSKRSKPFSMQTIFKKVSRVSSEIKIFCVCVCFVEACFKIRLILRLILNLRLILIRLRLILHDQFFR